MTKTETLQLIDGVFVTEDAKEILTKTFSQKINFHQLRNFISQERYGKEDEHAIQQISRLKNEVERAQKILSEAREKNKKLILTSEVSITIED